MEDLIVFGASGHTKVVIDILEKQGKYRIAGLIDSRRKQGEEFMGYKILGHDEDLKAICHQYDIANLLVAIGDNWIRHQVHEKIISTCSDIHFVTAIHPSAVIGKDVVIGEGSVVMAGTVINTATTIGKCCIINTSASVDHDCRLKDFSSIAPKACLGGNVTIGDFTSISIGATVIQGIEIGQHTVVGAGSTVIDNLTEKVVCHGSPARVIRKRKIGEKYF